MATDAAKPRNLTFNDVAREVIGDAYDFVRGEEFTKKIGNITFEELIFSAIARIEGTDERSEVRSTRLERVQRIKEEITAVVAKVKKLPPGYWAEAYEKADSTREGDNANTAEAVLV